MRGWLQRRRHGLAPALDGSDGPFVPALVGVLVYLAVIVTAAMLLVGGTAGRWSDALQARFTVQLATDTTQPEPAPGDDAADPETGGGRLAAALATIRAIPQVARALPMAENRLAAQLQPWLGGATIPSSLLPIVIEVELRPGSQDEAAAVRARLLAAMPDASVLEGPALLEPALRLMRGIEALTAFMLAVLTATLAACVVFATRARLAARAETIEILHLLGADDRVLVGLMARHALRTALIGGLAGFVLAAATMAAFAALAGGSDGVGTTRFALSPIGWAAVAALPFAAAVIAVLTARLTAGRALTALP